MTIQLLSALISLALMLTGSYGVEAPEPAYRTLDISNVNVSINGNTVTLNPSVSLGVGSEAGKALFDAGLELDGQRLFPMQLSVTEDALTALLVNADTAFKVPASAIDSLTQQTLGVEGDADDASAQIVTYMTQELIPAYQKVLEKAMDPEATKEMTAKAEALLAEIADRGEGEPDVIDIDGDSYDVTTYQYSLTNDQLMDLTDKVYNSDEDLKALYDAIFRLYDMLPEESGLNGIHSYADLYAATGVELHMDVVESVNSDGLVSVTDMSLTMDMSGAVEAAKTLEEQEEDEDEEAGDSEPMEPIVFDVHTQKLGDNIYSTISCDYVADEVSLSMYGDTNRDADGSSVDLTFEATTDEGDELSYTLSGGMTDTSRRFSIDMNGEIEGTTLSMVTDYTGGAAADSADWDYTLTSDMTISAKDIDINQDLTTQGTRHDDGTLESTVALGGEAYGITYGLSFDIAVTDDPIEDLTADHTAIEVTDLTNLGELLGSESLAPLQGSLMTDAGALMQDESVNDLVALFLNMTPAEPEGDAESIDVEDEEDLDDEDLIEEDFDDEDLIEEDFDDEDYEGQEEGDVSYIYGDEDVDYDYKGSGDEDDYEDDIIEYGDTIEVDTEEYDEEPEDDGELPYSEPEFTFIPDGMHIEDFEVDTAYDFVNVTILENDGDGVITAFFNPAAEDNATRYVMDESGKLTSVGGDIDITRIEENEWSVNITRDGVMANLYINADGMDEDTVAQIINGLTF